MSWLGRAIGDFGSQVGEGYQISQDWKQRDQQMKLEAARAKLAELLGPLQVQEIQARLREMNAPKYEGMYGLQGGGTGAAFLKPGESELTTQTLTPGMNRSSAKARISKMAEGVQSKEAKATLQSYADSIGTDEEPGEDPERALDKALQFMGTASTHAQVTGRLVKGDPIPDKNSVTGYSRPMYDGLGNLVRVVPNIVIPGLTPKEIQGWQLAETIGPDGEVMQTLVPKTTVTRPVMPGQTAQPSAGGAPPTKFSATSPGGAAQAASNLPRGARVIGEKPGEIQKDAVKASKDARDAAVVKKDVDDNIEAAKQGNAKASLALVFSAVRTMVMGAGRMTNVEIENELRAGSYEQRLERWYDMATKGTLPVDQMEQIRQVVTNGYEAKRQAGQQAWGYAYPNKTLPPWLRPPSATGGTTTSTPPPGAKVIPLDQFLQQGP